VHYLCEAVASAIVKQGNILAILRQLAEAGPPVSDAELLGRFVSHRNEDAFAALVQRHGRLVWAVCRQLAGPDADDAFQGTFLVLLKKAPKLSNADNLSAWLYGVAYRVSSRARQSAKRRENRERVAAVKNCNGSIVPDSAWDRVLIAVHEEIVKLPESLRVPFVLCTLEGKSVTEAAERLRCKYSTLSARLIRAKDTVLTRLQSRGITAGAITALACAGETAPAAVLSKTAEMVQVGATIPSSILSLTQGVLGMGAYHVKVLAAGVLLACGLSVGGGAGWLANAEAQVAPPIAPKMSPDEKVRQLEAQLEQAKREAEEAREAKKRADEAVKRKTLDLLRNAEFTREISVFSTAKWEYIFVPVCEMDTAKFVKFLDEQESRGWDFTGQVTLKKDGWDAATWVFRRPVTKPSGTQTNPSAKPKYDVAPLAIPDRAKNSADPNENNSRTKPNGPGPGAQDSLFKRSSDLPSDKTPPSAIPQGSPTTPSASPEPDGSQPK
jgi:RNA polymerase sigma factor (sigma-70 family)